MNQKLISQAVEALKIALDEWKTACIDATGNPNIEFLAQFEINLASILEKNTPEVRRRFGFPVINN